jgi:thiosulfate dehydrogenase [quinone] large subunit
VDVLRSGLQAALSRAGREIILSKINSKPPKARNPEYAWPRFNAQEDVMTEPTTDNRFVFLFRLLMAWGFLYAASHQGIFAPDWSVAGFLSRTKTFHDVFSIFATPSVAPIITFLVAWGHLLIGLSLLVGLMVRVSASFGIMLMLLYWMAHMDFPYIENRNNFVVDYHIVYACLLGYLIYKRTGHVWGLDQLASRIPLFRKEERLHPLVA